MSTTTDRPEAARRLCRRLADDVAGVAPREMGLWAPAWSSVTAASDHFLDLLHEWERTGDDATLPELRQAYYDVLNAWKSAAGQYRESAHA
jgi:hypothetical protein